MITRERMEEIIFVGRLLYLNCQWQGIVNASGISKAVVADRLWLTTKLFELCGLKGR